MDIILACLKGPVNRFVRVSNIAGGVHIPASELKHVSIAPTGLSTCKVVNVDLKRFDTSQRPR